MPPAVPDGGFSAVHIIIIMIAIEASTKGGANMLTCKRCGYKWEPRSETRPVSCPECKSRQWDGGVKRSVKEIYAGYTGPLLKVLCKDCGVQSLVGLEVRDGEVYLKDGGHKCKPAEKKPKGKKKSGKGA